MDPDMQLIMDLLDSGTTFGILAYALYRMGRSMQVQRETHYEQYEKLLEFLMEYCKGRDREVSE